MEFSWSADRLIQDFFRAGVTAAGSSESEKKARNDGAYVDINDYKWF